MVVWIAFRNLLFTRVTTASVVWQAGILLFDTVATAFPFGSPSSASSLSLSSPPAVLLPLQAPHIAPALPPVVFRLQPAVSEMQSFLHYLLTFLHPPLPLALYPFFLLLFLNLAQRLFFYLL